MNRIKMFFASVRDDLANGENLDAYVLFVLGISFALLGIFGFVDFNVLGAVILMALSLLVIGDVLNRHSNRELRNILTANQQGNASCPLKTFSVIDEQFVQSLGTAQTILLLGNSLYRSVSVQRNHIARALVNGGKVRLIVVNPYNESALKMAALASEDDISADTYKQRILSTVEETRNFKRRNPGADVLLRSIDYIPPFGLTVIVSKGEISHTWCHVRLQGFRKAVSESPVINPDPIIHGELLRFYREQFDLMWDAGTDIPLEPTA